MLDVRSCLINQENLYKINKKSIKEHYNIRKLIDNQNLTQSDVIRFGYVFENFLKNCIRNSGNKVFDINFLDVFNTGTNTLKGKKNLDIFFRIGKNNIYYFESKTNVNLDSEKTKLTNHKIEQIENYISHEKKILNGEITLICGTITCWWEYEKGMTNPRTKSLYYMKDFFELLNVNITKEEYYKIMSDFGKELNI